MRLNNMTASTRRCVQHIMSLSDAAVLSAARNPKSRSYALILQFCGPNTNRSWITAICAEIAYERDLIDEREFDWLYES